MLTGLRWALSLMIVTSLIGAAIAGFGDFPNAVDLARQVLATFIVAAAASAFTLTVIEIVAGEEDGAHG
jgi:hypothetical protein